MKSGRYLVENNKSIVLETKNYCSCSVIEVFDVEDVIYWRYASSSQAFKLDGKEPWKNPKSIK